MTPAGKTAIIVGAGPAGLAAAELLASEGWAVAIHERMPNPARKFLLAGRGGLDLTHSEPLDAFLARYGAARERLEPAIRAFTPTDLRAWAAGLGIETFVGSSGRVFPKQMKASPLLRAWLGRLGALGVTLVPRSRWIGWQDEALVFEHTRWPTRRNARRDHLCARRCVGLDWVRTAHGRAHSWNAARTSRHSAQRTLASSSAGPACSGDRFAGEPIKRASFSFGGQTRARRSHHRALRHRRRRDLCAGVASPRGSGRKRRSHHYHRSDARYPPRCCRRPSHHRAQGFKRQPFAQGGSLARLLWSSA